MQQVQARNQMINCNRQQLGVTKESRPIYGYDNKGNRQYVDDDTRAATTSSAEQRVANECQ